jgi:hypothetical protein
LGLIVPRSFKLKGEADHAEPNDDRREAEVEWNNDHEWLVA